MPSDEPPASGIRTPLLALAIIGTAIGLGHIVRTELGIEVSPTGIQDAVVRLGRWAPVVFFGLTTFRQFLAIPSWLILPAGGLCFGTLLGTTLGAGALVLSGCMKFGVARWLGREWARAHLGERFARFERRLDRLGPVAIGISTAHPFGVLAPFHWGAGVTSIRFGSFVAAIVLGAPVRAFAYSAFGAALIAPTPSELLLMSAGLGGVVLLPLLVPGVRRRLFASE
jgi:uncharacterized membrane protein YdjX (TVP38/TMEM64 family)